LNKYIKLSNEDFERFIKELYLCTGIFVEYDKKFIIENKLNKLLLKNNISSFEEYYYQIKTNEQERQKMINALTINETSFFRENKHFEYLKEIVANYRLDKRFRCWSAASSIGAEGYSASMIIDNYIGSCGWEVVFSDINDEVIKQAQKGIYNIDMASKIPMEFLKKYCLKSGDNYKQYFMISDRIIKWTTFKQINLISSIDNIGMFDVIFLRNILIYFDDIHKKKILDNVLSKLNVGGYIFMGHSEFIDNFTDKVKQIEHSIYQKQ